MQFPLEKMRDFDSFLKNSKVMAKKLWPQALKRCQNYKIIAQSGHTAYVFSPFSCPLEAEEKTEEQNFIIFHDRDQMAV